MVALLLVVGLSLGLSGRPRCESVDLIELNHMYDAKGALIFDQVIFYERMPETGIFRVRSWCLAEDSLAMNRRPERNYMTGRYQVYWFDTDQMIHRKVSSELYRETWTQVDPERIDGRLYEGKRVRVPLSERTVKRDE